MSRGATYILLDFENCPHETAQGLRGGDAHLILFLGPHQTKLPLELVEALQPMGDKVRFVRLATPGKNSLDFHIALLLGQLVAENPLGSFFLISKDQGFDSILKYLTDRSIKAERFASIKEVAKLGAAKSLVPAGKASAPAAPKEQEIVSATAELLVKRLKNPKTTRPRSIKTVATVIKSIASPQLLPDQIQLVIDQLTNTGVLQLSPTGRVSYAFEDNK